MKYHPSVWLGVSLLAALSSAAGTIVVAPNGQDGNPGTATAPFASLERARDEVRKLKAGGLKGGLEVQLRGGTYWLAQPWRLGAQDSGEANAPVSYSAFPGERPVLSGGKLIGGWRKGEGNLWQADVPEVKTGKLWFHQLFVNGQRCTPARLPNEGWLRMAGPTTNYVKDMKKLGGNKQIRTEFKFKPGDLKSSWRNLSDVRLVFYHSWTDSLHWLDQVDEAKHVAKMVTPTSWPLGWWETDQRYHVENVREGLDAPGEWYLDRQAGRVEYYPRPGEDMTKAQVVAPVLDQLLVLEGDYASGQLVHDVTFRGLAFEHTDFYVADKTKAIDGQAAAFLNAAVQASGAARIALENCTVAHVGNYAIWFEAGCKSNRVAHCELHDLGAGGVRLGETMRQSTAAKENAVKGQAVKALSLDGTGARDTGHNVVDNCFIHDGTKIFTGAVGVFIGHSAYNRVTHNEICDLFYTGVSAGWVWGFGQSAAHHNTIADNHIHHLGWGVMSDMGGVYTLGPQPGTVVAHNHIHHVNAYSYGGWGMYTDEGSSEETWENNIVYDTKTGGFHQHYGKDNIIRNNILAFSRETQVRRSREDVTCSFTFEHNIVYCDNDQVLTRVFKNNDYHLDHNIYWTTGKSEPLFDNRTWDDWRATSGQDKNSALTDPMFVDAEKRDFRLKPESPALSLGFKPIELAGIGLYGEPEWVGKPAKVTRPEFVLPATALPAPTGVADDFESTPVGSKPKIAHVAGANEQAHIRVTAETASKGKQSLKFTDAPGQPQKYFPMMHYTLISRKGVAHCAFDVKMGKDAFLQHEWRDAAKVYQSGPSLNFTDHGQLLAGKQELMPIPLGKWVHVEIVCGLGPKCTGTYDLSVTVEGQPTRKFPQLPNVKPGFKNLEWLGFISQGTQQAEFYLDEVKLEVK